MTIFAIFDFTLVDTISFGGIDGGGGHGTGEMLPTFCKSPKSPLSSSLHPPASHILKHRNWSSDPSPSTCQYSQENHLYISSPHPLLLACLLQSWLSSRIPILVIDCLVDCLVDCFDIFEFEFEHSRPKQFQLCFPWLCQ